MENLQHEPETKSWNKARSVQDELIRLRKNGCASPKEAGPSLYDWILNDASASEGTDAMEYLACLMWGNVGNKIKAAVGKNKPRHKNGSGLSAEQKDNVRKEVRNKLETQWLDKILNMTGAELRATAALPPEIRDRVGDNQRLGEVFSADELRQYAPAAGF